MVTMAEDENGKPYRVVAVPDLTDPNNPSNPASLYWNVEHEQVFCKVLCSMEAHSHGYRG